MIRIYMANYIAPCFLLFVAETHLLYIWFLQFKNFYKMLWVEMINQSIN